MQILVTSAPILETLGYISELYIAYKFVFVSTVIQVAMYVLHLTFSTRLLISYILCVHISYIIICTYFFVCILAAVLMLCSMVGKGTTHQKPDNCGT